MNSARMRLAALASRQLPRLSVGFRAAPLAPQETIARLQRAAAVGGWHCTRRFAVSIPKGDITADLTEIVPDLGHHWKKLEKSTDKHSPQSKPQKEPPPPPPTLLGFDDLREVPTPNP